MRRNPGLGDGALAKLTDPPYSGDKLGSYERAIARVPRRTSFGPRPASCCTTSMPSSSRLTTNTEPAPGRAPGKQGIPPESS